MLLLIKDVPVRRRAADPRRPGAVLGRRRENPHVPFRLAARALGASFLKDQTIRDVIAMPPAAPSELLLAGGVYGRESSKWRPRVEAPGAATAGASSVSITSGFTSWPTQGATIAPFSWGTANASFVLHGCTGRARYRAGSRCRGSPSACPLVALTLHPGGRYRVPAPHRSARRLGRILQRHVQTTRAVSPIDSRAFRNALSSSPGGAARNRTATAPR